MYKSPLILLLVVIFIVGVAWVTKNPANPTYVGPVVQQENYQSNKNVATVTTTSVPRVLRIPKLSVEAGVESVGMDKEGKMDVPKDVNNVSWFSLGFKPGEPGSAVMAGHLDTKTEAPAVFYDLNKLQAGDEIIVVSESGQEHRFKVTKKATYTYDKFPLQEVFGSTDKARLNLITCTGEWDKGSKNYSQRMVVYSELME